MDFGVIVASCTDFKDTEECPPNASSLDAFSGCDCGEASVVSLRFSQHHGRM